MILRIDLDLYIESEGRYRRCVKRMSDDLMTNQTTSQWRITTTKQDLICFIFSCIFEMDTFERDLERSG